MPGHVAQDFGGQDADGGEHGDGEDVSPGEHLSRNGNYRYMHPRDRANLTHLSHIGTGSRGNTDHAEYETESPGHS